MTTSILLVSQTPAPTPPSSSEPHAAIRSTGEASGTNGSSNDKRNKLTIASPASPLSRSSSVFRMFPWIYVCERTPRLAVRNSVLKRATKRASSSVKPVVDSDTAMAD